MGELFGGQRRSKNHERHTRRKSEGEGGVERRAAAESKHSIPSRTSKRIGESVLAKKRHGIDEDMTRDKTVHRRREHSGSIHHSSSGKARVRLQLKPSLTSLRSAPGEWPRDAVAVTSRGGHDDQVAPLRKLASERTSWSLFGRSSSRVSSSSRRSSSRMSLSRADDVVSESMPLSREAKKDRPSLYSLSSRRSTRSALTL